MHNTLPTALLHQLLAAQLEPKVQHLVLRLFALTRDHTVTLAKAQFIEVAGASSWPRARTYLTVLRAAGLAYITTGEYIYFAWLNVDGQWYGSDDQAAQRSALTADCEADVIASDQPANPRATDERSDRINDCEAEAISDD
jgi:hypothetical protein